MSLSRRRLSAFFVGCAALLASYRAVADEPSVPPRLQADLSAKVIDYVQTPAPRDNDVIRIGILTKAGDVDSTHVGTELKATLDKVDTIAGLPHEQVMMTWLSADRVAQESKERKLFALYVAPGLGPEISAIARALDGVPLVTIAAVDAYVLDGAILSFEQVSGHPRMVFNLTQARRQGVTFRSGVMRLMRIVE
jgi:hypothetical protein